VTEQTYLFERTQQDAGHRRLREDAVGEVETFLSRVGEVGTDGTDAPLEGFRESRDWELLLQFAMEVQLNIRWYEQHIDRQTRWDGVWRTVVLLLGAVALAGLPLLVVFLELPIAERLASGSLNLLITQFGILFSGFVAYLKLLASAMDKSALQQGFWEASADLKEQLYTFEREWKKSPVFGGDGLSDDFRDALMGQIAAARTTVRAERRASFEARQSPVALLEALSGSADAVSERGGEVAAARAELAAMADPYTQLLNDRREARAAHDAARREVQALEYRAQVLRAASDLPERDALVADTLSALIDARVEVQRRRMALEALSGAPR